ERGTLVGIDRESGEIALEVALPGEPPFVRGMCVLDEGHVVVGNQRPAALYVVDLGARKVVEVVDLGGAPGGTVYGLGAGPEGFANDYAPLAEWPRGG